MSTTTVQTMARPTHTITSRGAGPHSNQSSSVCIKDLMINELTDGAASGSADEGFYSADLFDSLDEENFIQAQRDAFTAINDAALARAIQESEMFAAKKAAEENRRRMANASATGRESRASSSAAAHIPPAPVNTGPYALVSPSELGQSSTRPRRYSSAAAPVASSSLASSSRTTPSAPLPAKSSSPSRSQYPSASSSMSTSSPLSLSTSASPPSRTHPPASYRPSNMDRQQSSRYYSTQTQNQRPATATQPKVTPTPPVPATMTRPTTTSRQAAPNHSSMTTNASNFYSSNISATSATARAYSSSNNPRSSSTSRSAAPAPPSTTPPRPTHATWKPPTIPSSSSTPIPSPAIAIPRSREMPIPRSGPAMSTSASARELRMGMMASGSPKTTQGVRMPNSRLGSSPKPIPGRGRQGRRISPGPEAKWARAKRFLSRNCERECRKCGWAVEGAAGSAPIPTEPFSYLLLRHLHVTCSNPECKATYCRGCLSSVDGLCQPTGESSSASSSPSSSASSSPAPSRKGSFSSSAQPTPNVIPGVTTCQGSRGCDIKSCCTYSSITAISTILDAFDMEFTRAAYASGFSSPASFVEEAQAFVRVVIARTNSDVRNTKAFEGAVIRSLHAMLSWLVVFQERKEEEDDDDSDDDDEEQQGKRKRRPDLVQDLLYPLISRSLLPSLIHAFLQNRNVGDWLKHGEIYVLILEVLRKLVDNGLGRILDEPIITADQSEEELSSSPENRWNSAKLARGMSSSPGNSTSESSSGGEDLDSSESERGTETDDTSPAEDSDDDDDDDSDEDEDKRNTLHGSDISSTPTQTASSARAAFAVTRLPIRALVAKLEEHRAPLMAFGATVKFPATKAKVHTLCDGISYLLLQQLFAAD